jgi:hypothetical protein
MFSLRSLIVCTLVSLAGTVVGANADVPAPGVVNYSEGQVAVNGQAVQTRQGRAEVLLTPGVYLRVGENSSVKMENSASGGVKLELLGGQALVEVDQVTPGRRVDIIDQSADAHLERPGIYLFKAGDPVIDVYSGKLRVQDDQRSIELKRGEELRLTGAPLKAQKFDRTDPGALYAWSAQRAGYSSQVSEWTAEDLLGLDGLASYSAGWYWSPWYNSWAFIPTKGYILTPFDYGLYAPQTPKYRTPVFGDFRN